MKRIIGIFLTVIMFLGICLSFWVNADEPEQGIGAIAVHASIGEACITLKKGGEIIDVVCSDSEGNYIFENIPVGTDYCVYARKTRCIASPDSVDDIEVLENETIEVYISLIGECGVGVKRSVPTLTAGTVYGCPGGEVVAPILIENDSRGTDFRMDLYYDKSLLIPISAESGSVTSEDNFAYEITEEHIRISGNISLIKDSVNDIAYVSFITNDDVNQGNAELSPKNVSVWNSYGGIAYEWVSGTVKITSYPYEISNTVLSSYSGEILEIVPQNGGFIVEAKVTEVLERNSRDYFIIAVYDTNGGLIGLNYIKMDVPSNTSISFGINIPQTDFDIGNITVFVWDSFSEMTPLAERINMSSSSMSAG